jgi:hypothetical protein
MRHIDIIAPYQGTPSHPYLARVTLDPTELARFERLNEDQHGVQILGVDRSMPDEWTIYAACASRTGRDLLESNW